MIYHDGKTCERKCNQSFSLITFGGICVARSKDAPLMNSNGLLYNFNQCAEFKCVPHLVDYDVIEELRAKVRHHLNDNCSEFKLKNGETVIFQRRLAQEYTNNFGIIYLGQIFLGKILADGRIRRAMMVHFNVTDYIPVQLLTETMKRFTEMGLLKNVTDVEWSSDDDD